MKWCHNTWFRWCEGEVFDFDQKTVILKINEFHRKYLKAPKLLLLKIWGGGHLFLAICGQCQMPPIYFNKIRDLWHHLNTPWTLYNMKSGEDNSLLNHEFLRDVKVNDSKTIDDSRFIENGRPMPSLRDHSNIMKRVLSLCYHNLCILTLILTLERVIHMIPNFY